MAEAFSHPGRGPFQKMQSFEKDPKSGLCNSLNHSLSMDHLLLNSHSTLTLLFAYYLSSIFLVGDDKGMPNRKQRLFHSIVAAG